MNLPTKKRKRHNGSQRAKKRQTEEGKKIMERREDKSKEELRKELESSRREVSRLRRISELNHIFDITEIGLRNVVETLSDGIIILDEKETIIYASPMAHEMFGYDEFELIGKGHEALVPRHSRERHVKLCKQYFLNPAEIPIGSTHKDFVGRKKDGKEFYIDVGLSSIKTRKGLFALSLIRDIDKQKRAENALEAKKQELLSQVKITSDFMDILERTATSLNFHESLNKILVPINNLFGSEYCFVYCLDAKEKTLQPSHQLNLAQEGLAYFMSSYVTLAGYRTFARNDDVIFANMSELMTGLHFNIQKLLKHILSESLLIIPIAYEEELQSLIICSYNQRMTFPDKQRNIAVKLQKLLESRFMSQTHSLNLLDKTMDFTQQLQMAEAMSNIDRSVLTSSNEEEIVYGTIKQFWKVIPSEITEILKYDPETGNYNLIAAYENEQIEISPGESFTVKDIKSRMSIKFGVTDYYPDISKEALPGKYEKRFLKKDYKSLMVIPLLAKGESVGLLAIANRKSSAYSPAHLSVAHRLGDQVAVGLSNTGLIKQLQDLLVGTIKSLIITLDAKSKWTQGHSERVSETALKLGKALGVGNSQLHELKLAALFHDIGKIGTYDVILEKPEILSEEEKALIKKHPAKTFDILQPIPKLRTIANYALHHHERWDGEGYPDGLAGEEIPLLSRIIGLADAFDAMTSDRPYRKALSNEQAIKEISSLAGKQFDPEMAGVFISLIREQEIKPLKRRKAA